MENNQSFTMRMSAMDLYRLNVAAGVLTVRTGASVSKSDVIRIALENLYDQEEIEVCTDSQII